MAKTTFVDGTSTIWASFMNSIFNTDGGHKHDGGTDDGSAGKIDPATEVDWGTNAAASLLSDTASKVHWRLKHAASGIFGITMDFLWGMNHIHTGTGTLYVGSAPSTPDHDLSCKEVFATGDLTTSAGDINVTLGDITSSLGTVTGVSVTALGTAEALHVVATGSLTGANSKDIDESTPDVVLSFDTGGGARTILRDVGSKVTSVSRSGSAVYTIVLADAVNSTNSRVDVSHTSGPSDPSLGYNVSWTNLTTLVVRFNEIGSGHSESDPTVAGHVNIWDF